MPITIRLDEPGRQDGPPVPMLMRLKNWLIGPAPGSALPPKDECPASARARTDIELLDHEGLAKAISEVLWSQRGSLKLRVEVRVPYYRGIHSREKHIFEVTMPEGIVMSLGEKCDHILVTAPDGEEEILQAEAATRLATVWKTIQAMSMCDALGIEIPQGNEGIRSKTVLGAIDAAVCAIVERSDPPQANETFEMLNEGGDLNEPDWVECRSSWKDLGCGVFLDDSETYESHHRDEPRVNWYRLMTAEMGVLRLPREALSRALERRKRTSFANALGLARALPVHLPMPSGNAQAARILRLCREAVAREPELVDAKGTPIAPLVEQHLPRLMQKHAEAARIAETSELAAIDAELMQGIERVRLAVEEALVVSRVDKREALRTELAFLEYRHPTPSVLSLDDPKDTA